MVFPANLSPMCNNESQSQNRKRSANPLWCDNYGLERFISPRQEEP